MDRTISVVSATLNVEARNSIELLGEATDIAHGVGLHIEKQSLQYMVSFIAGRVLR